MNASPEDVKSPGLWPSHRFKGRRWRQLREEGARSALIAAASTIIFVGAVVGWILTSEFWPAVQKQFFNPENFAEAWPDVLGDISLGFKSSFPFIDFQGSGFWLNVYMFLIAEVLILVFSLILAMIRALSAQIRILEKSILSQVEPDAGFHWLKTTPGIGDILAEAILLETGDIARFPKPGNYASYCRCVDSRRESNGKKRGENNRKNGNRYLAWAFIEAANFAIRRSEKARRFYLKKEKATNAIVARKALAHKLARGCYWVMRNQQAFDQNKVFG